MPRPTLAGTSPLEIVRPGRLPDLSHIRIMGQECYTGRPVPDRDGKLDRAADRSIFCGMAPDFKGWITYCIRTRQFDASVDVRFPPGPVVFPMALLHPTAPPPPPPPPRPVPATAEILAQIILPASLTPDSASITRILLSNTPHIRSACALAAERMAQNMT